MENLSDVSGAPKENKEMKLYSQKNGYLIDPKGNHYEIYWIDEKVEVPIKSDKVVNLLAEKLNLAPVKPAKLDNLVIGEKMYYRNAVETISPELMANFEGFTQQVNQIISQLGKTEGVQPEEIPTEESVSEDEGILISPVEKEFLIDVDEGLSVSSSDISAKVDNVQLKIESQEESKVESKAEKKTVWSAFKQMWVRRGVLNRLEKVVKLDSTSKNQIKEMLKDQDLLVKFEAFINAYEAIVAKNKTVPSPETDESQSFGRLHQELFVLIDRKGFDSHNLSQALRKLVQKAYLPHHITAEIRETKRFLNLSRNEEASLKNKLSNPKLFQLYDQFLEMCIQAKQQNQPDAGLIKLESPHNQALLAAKQKLIKEFHLSLGDPIMNVVEEMIEQNVMVPLALSEAYEQTKKLIKKDINFKDFKNNFTSLNRTSIQNYQHLIEENGSLAKLPAFSAFITALDHVDVSSENSIKLLIDHYNTFLKSMHAKEIEDDSNVLTTTLFLLLPLECREAIRQEVIRDTSAILYERVPKAAMESLAQCLENPQFLASYHCLIQTSLAKTQANQANVTSGKELKMTDPFNKAVLKQTENLLNLYGILHSKIASGTTLPITSLFVAIRESGGMVNYQFITDPFLLGIYDQANIKQGNITLRSLNNIKVAEESIRKYKPEEQLLIRNKYLPNATLPDFWQKMEWNLQFPTQTLEGNFQWQNAWLKIGFAIPGKKRVEQSIPLGLGILGLKNFKEQSVVFEFIRDFFDQAHSSNVEDARKWAQSQRKELKFLDDAKFDQLLGISERFYLQIKAATFDMQRVVVGGISLSGVVMQQFEFTKPEEAEKAFENITHFLSPEFNLSTEQKAALKVALTDPTVKNALNNMLQKYSANRELFLEALQNPSESNKDAQLLEIEASTNKQIKTFAKNEAEIIEIVHLMEIKGNSPATINKEIQTLEKLLGHPLELSERKQLITLLDSHPQTITQFEKALKTWSQESKANISIDNKLDGFLKINDGGLYQALHSNPAWQKSDLERIKRISEKLLKNDTLITLSEVEKAILANVKTFYVDARNVLAHVEKNNIKDCPFDIEALKAIEVINNFDNLINMQMKNLLKSESWEALKNQDLAKLEIVANKHKGTGETLTEKNAGLIIHCKRLESEFPHMIEEMKKFAMREGDQKLLQSLEKIRRISQRFTIGGGLEDYKKAYENEAERLHDDFVKKHGTVDLNGLPSLKQLKGAFQIAHEKFPFLIKSRFEEKEMLAATDLVNILIYGKGRFATTDPVSFKFSEQALVKSEKSFSLEGGYVSWYKKEHQLESKSMLQTFIHAFLRDSLGRENPITLLDSQSEIKTFIPANPDQSVPFYQQFRSNYYHYLKDHIPQEKESCAAFCDQLGIDFPITEKGLKEIFSNSLGKGITLQGRTAEEEFDKIITNITFTEEQLKELSIDSITAQGLIRSKLLEFFMFMHLDVANLPESKIENRIVEKASEKDFNFVGKGRQFSIDQNLDFLTTFVEWGIDRLSPMETQTTVLKFTKKMEVSLGKNPSNARNTDFENVRFGLDAYPVLDELIEIFNPETITT